jgi:hypothetical protein
VIVDDIAKRREFSMKVDNPQSRKSVLNRSSTREVQQWVPPPPTYAPPPQPLAFKPENAVMVGLIVVSETGQDRTAHRLLPQARRPPP